MSFFSERMQLITVKNGIHNIMYGFPLSEAVCIGCLWGTCVSSCPVWQIRKCYCCVIADTIQIHYVPVHLCKEEEVTYIDCLTDIF